MENSLIRSIEADSIFIFNNESTAVFRNDYLEIFDSGMNKITQRNNILNVKESGKNLILYGINGVQIISTSTRGVSQLYDDVKAGEIDIHSSRLIAVKKGESWGYISSNGDQVIPFQFEDAWPFVYQVFIL